MQNSWKRPCRRSWISTPAELAQTTISAETSLAKAEEKIAALLPVVDTLAAADTYELMQIYELRERLIVCRAVIAHLAARKETRWHSFGENTDYPEQSEDWMKYVNSRMENGEIKILYRDLITKETADSQTAAFGIQHKDTTDLQTADSKISTKYSSERSR